MVEPMSYLTAFVVGLSGGVQLYWHVRRDHRCADLRAT